MLSHQIGMIIIHGKGTLYRFVNQTVIFGITYYGNKGQRVNQKRQHNKGTATEKEQLPYLFLRKVC